MRTSRVVGSLILFSSLACSTSSETTPKDKPASDDAGVDSAVSACDGKAVAPLIYSGRRAVVSWSEHNRCLRACPSLDESCVAAACSESAALAACLDGEFLYCITSQDSPCRAQWEALGCCKQSCEGAGSSASVADCVAASCGAEQLAFDTCERNNVGGSECARAAKASCLYGVPSDGADPALEDGGVPDDAGVDPACRAMVPTQLDHYAGDKPFTREELMACQMKCGQDESCLTEQNCPGFTAFSDCANDELLACSASSGGRCRGPFEAYVCCIDASGCDPNDGTCVRQRCNAQVNTFVSCAQKDTTCQSSFSVCFGT